MKYGFRKWKLAAFAVFFSIAMLMKPCCGMDTSEIVIEGMTEEDAERSLIATGLRKSDLNVLKRGEPTTLLVTPFWIAVGTENHVVGVFDVDGNLLYIIRFTTNGKYALYYDQRENGLVIEIYRNGEYYYLNEEGKLRKISSRDCPQTGLEESHETDIRGNQYAIERESRIGDFYLYRYAQVIQRGNDDNVMIEFRYYINMLRIYVLLCMLGGGLGAYILKAKAVGKEKDKL